MTHTARGDRFLSARACDQSNGLVVRIAHAGPGAARNAGLAIATGKWIRFVDCDDVFDPDSTARLLRLAAGDEPNEGGRRYAVERVEEAASPLALGHAWVMPIDR